MLWLQGKGLAFTILRLYAYNSEDSCINCRWGLSLRLRDSSIKASMSLSVGFEVSLDLVST